MAKEWLDANNSRRNDENSGKNYSNSTSMTTNSPPRKYYGNGGNNGNWREPYHGQNRPVPFIQRQIPRNYTFQPRKPFVPRKYPLQAQTTHYSRNYKQEAERQNRLPAFTFNNLRYRNNSADIQGYRDPKYFNNNKFKKYTKPTDIEVDEVNLLVSPQSIQPDSDFTSVSNASNPNDQCSALFEPVPVVIEEDAVNQDQDRSETSHFQIKMINSYKEFSQIKSKSLINLPSKYETISFLKALLPNPKQPIILFFDENDRVFYGAAVVCLDEFLEREELDTSTIESLSLKLNWIFLSEVEESVLNFSVNISEPLDPQNGLEVLKLMEEFETRLHDVKKIKPAKLRLKLSRLEELEDFFRLTEERMNGGEEVVRTDAHLIDYSILEQMDTRLLAYNMTEIMNTEKYEIMNTEKYEVMNTEMVDIKEIMSTEMVDINEIINTEMVDDMPAMISTQTFNFNMTESMSTPAEIMNNNTQNNNTETMNTHTLTDTILPAASPAEIISNDDDFFDDYF